MLATIPRAEEREKRLVNQRQIVSLDILSVHSVLPVVGIQLPSGTVLLTTPIITVCRIEVYRLLLSRQNVCVEILVVVLGGLSVYPKYFLSVL
jgi:hypothetical protein